jgi:nitroreductase
MDFVDVVRKRRSVRRFSSQPVDPAALERILDAGTRGPTAGYSQGQSFILITDPATITAIATLQDDEERALTGREPRSSPPAFGAPVMICACTNEADYHRRYQLPDKVLPDGSEIGWPVPFWHFDIGAAVMLLLLAAVNEGLAAVFVGPTQDVQKIRDVLSIPDEVTPAGFVILGHRAPDEVKRSDLSRRRRPLADYVHRERW